MSAEQKPNEIELWLNFLEEEHSKMQASLSDISDPKLRGELKDQLIWLRHQMKTFETSHDVESIQEDYNWIAKSFNSSISHKL